MAASRKRIGFGLSAGAGTLWTILRFVWDRIGDAQQAKQLAEDQPDIAVLFWNVVLSEWIGPVVAVGSLITYLCLEYWPRQKKTGMVQLFTHTSAGDAPAVPVQDIERLFAAMGWQVTRGFTSLGIHADGVWVHGGRPLERQTAIESLLANGITPRVDDRDEDVPVQVIIGRSVRDVNRGTRREPTRDVQKDESGVDVHRENTPPDSEDTEAPKDVVVSWGSSNCTGIRVYNGSPRTISDPKVVIREIKWLFKGEWVSPEEAPENEFPVLAEPLNDRKTSLAPDANTEFRFVHTVAAWQVTTGVRGKTTRRPIRLTHHGQWKVIACAKWTDEQKQQYEIVKELMFAWMKGSEPLAAPTQ